MSSLQVKVMTRKSSAFLSINCKFPEAPLSGGATFLYEAAFQFLLFRVENTDRDEVADRYSISSRPCGDKSGVLRADFEHPTSLLKKTWFSASAFSVTASVTHCEKILLMRPSCGKFIW
jgi:hypothetical protein